MLVSKLGHPDPCRCQMCQTVEGINMTVATEDSIKKVRPTSFLTSRTTCIQGRPCCEKRVRSHGTGASINYRLNTEFSVSETKPFTSVVSLTTKSSRANLFHNNVSLH